jgi:pentapeptide MXKDX repeat protein
VNGGRDSHIPQIRRPGGTRISDSAHRASHDFESARNPWPRQTAPTDGGGCFAINNLWRSLLMIKSRLMLPLTAATLSLGLALAPAAFAQDKMKKDKMEKSSMSKDDGMKKDKMSKDKMSKDKMKK